MTCVNVEMIKHICTLVSLPPCVKTINGNDISIGRLFYQSKNQIYL